MKTNLQCEHKEYDTMGVLEIFSKNSRLKKKINYAMEIDWKKNSYIYIWLK